MLLFKKEIREIMTKLLQLASTVTSSTSYAGISISRHSSGSGNELSKTAFITEALLKS